MIDLQVVRHPGTVEKCMNGYYVNVSIAWTGDELPPDPGIPGLNARFFIPSTVGDKMTFDELIAEAFRRFDCVKHLL